MRRLIGSDLDAARALVESSAAVRAAAAAASDGVIDVAAGSSRFHVGVREGVAFLAAGPAGTDLAWVRLSEDDETAEAIASGSVNAQRAFLDGRLSVSGDIGVLVAMAPVIAAIDAALDEGRA